MSPQNHKLVDALSNRKFYLDKICEAKKVLENDAKFNELTAYSLIQKKARLEHLFDNFEKKCMELKQVDENAQLLDEDNQTESDCDALKEKIDRRLQELNATSEQASLKMGLEHYTIPKRAKVMSTQPAPMQQVYIDATVANETQNIEIFDGELSKWYEFRDDFEKKIHTKDIEKSEKMSILKRLCGEQVRKCVYELSENDYDEAWSKLNDTYGSAYTQMQYWFNKLNKIPTMREASLNSVRLLLERAETCVKNLSETMQLEQFQRVVVAIIVQRLDSQTLHIWERHRSGLALSWATPDASENKRSVMQHIPTWSDMQDFLKSELKIHTQSEIQKKLQQCVEDKTGYVSQQQAQNDEASGQITKGVAQVVSIQKHAAEAERMRPEDKAKQPGFLQCTLCEFVHPRFKCSVYLSFTYEQKWRHVSEQWLCIKCLRPEHNPNPCEDRNCERPCPTCEPYGVVRCHNSTLCPVKHHIDPTVRMEGYNDWRC